MDLAQAPVHDQTQPLLSVVVKMSIDDRIMYNIRSHIPDDLLFTQFQFLSMTDRSRFLEAIDKTCSILRLARLDFAKLAKHQWFKKFKGRMQVVGEKIEVLDIPNNDLTLTGFLLVIDRFVYEFHGKMRTVDGKSKFE